MPESHNSSLLLVCKLLNSACEPCHPILEGKMQVVSVVCKAQTSQ